MQYFGLVFKLKDSADKEEFDKLLIDEILFAYKEKLEKAGFIDCDVLPDVLPIDEGSAGNA